VFDFLKITVLPISYFIVTKRVEHIDYENQTPFLIKMFGEFKGVWFIFFGFAISSLINLFYLIIGSNGLCVIDDSSSSDNMNKSIDLKHQSHPTNILSHLYSKIHRIINCFIFLTISLAHYYMNRKYPELHLYMIIGLSLFLFNKVVKYKVEFNHVFRYKKVRRHSKFNGKD
jgi:hypothetical protein